MATEHVPTREEWGKCPAHVLDLDWNWSFEHYAGKSNEEVAATVAGNPLSAAEDVRYMNRVPFRYYVKGYCECLAQRRFDAHHMADAASCLFGTIEYKLQHDPASLLPVDETVMRTLQFAADQQDEIEASHAIYGDFQEKLRAIQQRLRDLGAKV